ncbi:MAG: zinc-dependent alcohol dehydrogenase [Candidatus Brocadiia bacterium]
MKAAVHAGNRRIELVELPRPEPGPGEVLLQVMASGLCGSELGGFRGPKARSGPAGHEMAGVVAEAGPGTRLQPGQRVGVQSIRGCGACLHCLRGDATLCPRRRGVGGSEAEFVAVPEFCCLPLPDDVGFDAAVLLAGDTLGVANKLLNRMGLCGADRVGIFGAGPIGLGMTAVAAFLGARCIVVEPHAYRRRLAATLGAVDAIDPREGEVVEALRERTGGAGPSAAIVCVGLGDVLRTALEAVAGGGKVGLVGECAQATIRPSETLIRKSLTLYGSWYTNWVEYFELLERRRQGLAVEPIVTHAFPLDQAEEAYRLFDSGETGKVMLHPAD